MPYVLKFFLLPTNYIDFHFVAGDKNKRLSSNSAVLTENVWQKDVDEQTLECFIHKKAFDGGTSTFSPASHASECKSTCLEATSCVAFTFVQDFNHCLLYSSVGKISSSSVLNSFVVVSGLKSCFLKSIDADDGKSIDTDDGKPIDGNKKRCIKYGFSFAGTKPSVVANSKTLSKCKSNCIGNGNCVAFTFVKTDGRCLMYNKNHNELRESNWARDKGWTSALISCFDDKRSDESDSCLIKEKKYAKGLLETISTETVDQCANICKVKTYCSAFSVCIAIKKCFLFDMKAFTKNMESNTNTKSYISADVSCYFKRRKSADEGIGSCLIKQKKYSKGLLEIVNADNADECAKKCKKKTDCAAFSLCTVMKQCLLFDMKAFKKDMEYSTETETYVSAELSCFLKEQKSIHDGSDSCLIKQKLFAKGLIETVSAKTVSQCASRCKKKIDCAAFSICTIMMKCLLFDSKAFTKEMESGSKTKSYVSAEMSCYFNNQKSTDDALDGCLVQQKKYAKGLLDIVNADNADECAKKCKKKTDCAAFSLCTVMKQCLLFDMKAFKKDMEYSTETETYVSAELSCYLKEQKSIDDGSDSCLIRQKKYAKGLIDIGNAETADECANKCKKETDCAAFSLCTIMKQCLLFNFKAFTVNMESSAKTESYVSSELSCYMIKKRSIKSDKNDNQRCRKYGSSFVGTKPVEVSRTKTFGQCKSKCIGNVNCAAFTFVKKDGRCLMFDENHNELRESSWAREKGWQSALISCFDDKGSDDSDSCLIRRKKYAKGLLDTVSAGTVDQCASRCKQKIECVAFSVCTIMKRCWLFDAVAFTKSMESSTKTKSIISAELKCYFKKQDNDKHENLWDFDEDTCMKDNRRIWSGRGSIIKEKKGVSSYYGCKNLCEKTNECKAFSLCKKPHACVMFKEGYKLKSQTVEPNWSSGVLQCYNKQGK